MLTIWKFELDAAKNMPQSFSLPKGAKVLTALPAPDCEKVWLYAEVNQSAPNEDRQFWIVGTGHPQVRQGRQWIYIGSCLCLPYVWHVYEEVR
jgi:hypothetical protein